MNLTTNIQPDGLSNPSPLLSISGLTGPMDKPADLILNKGECIIISGASGSGKSRLLRAIADLDDNSGDVMLEQTPRKEIMANTWRQKVALVPAETSWWAEKVGEHFLTDCPTSWLQQFGFDSEVMDWVITRLSTGERQRLGLLRALILSPDVLLLDEPTANLDAKFTAAVEALLDNYRKETGAGIIWISHDSAQQKRVASRIFLIENGLLELVI